MGDYFLWGYYNTRPVYQHYSGLDFIYFHVYYIIVFPTKYPYSGTQPTEKETGERNKTYIEEIRRKIQQNMEEELKTNLQSRLRFRQENNTPNDSSNRGGNTNDTTSTPAAPTPDEAWPEEADGPQDETNLDPDPLPNTWRNEVDGHIRETDQWMNNPQPEGTSHFIQRDVLMEPRRLRSAGIQRPLMIPDIFKRGGQEQTFGSQMSQREAVSILQDTTAITEQEAKEIIGKINPRNQSISTQWG